MALTTTATASTKEEWETAFFEESIRDSGFKPYMGRGASNPFVVKNQLIQGGQVVHIPLVMALREAGTGTGSLVNNEEAVLNYNYDLKPYWHRKAVAVNRDEQHKSSFDILKAMTDMLKIWDQDEMRDAIINACGSVIENSGSFNSATGHSKEVFFSEATTAQKNTFAAANEHRILFGDSESNYNATFATGLATVDAAADRLTAANISLMKRMAKRRQRTKAGATSDIPSIRPIRTGSQGREFFVCFTGSENFAKLKTDATMAQANREARPRDVEANPLFQDGDLIYDGVVIREIPEIPTTSATVAPAYFCGAQALGHAWGQRPRGTERKEDDYGFIKGVGTESLWSCEKLRYDGRDHGMITGFFYTN
jgi:hypothetical protein